MMDGLGWTKSDLGVLTGSLFWAYGIGQFVNGRLSEIIGPSKFVVASIILSAFANVMLSFQSSIVLMSIIWGVNGYFQSMAWTPGIAILTKWWPGATRGFATGFAHAFSGFGQVAAILVVALSFNLFPAMGWRAAFILPVMFPLMMLLSYLIFARVSPSQIGLSEYVETNPIRTKIESEMQSIVKTKGKLYPY
jgi:sugar phosphate permease